MAELSLTEEIELELSQYASSLLAWKSWGTVAPEKIHDLKIESRNNIISSVLKRIEKAKLTDEEINDIAEITAEIWRSGKENSQVFDYSECLIRERWVARLVSKFNAQLDKIKKELE
jgi:hypothetical protein